MTGTVIVTLGRLPKGLDICRSFAAMGWRVVVAEPHARHLCGASTSVSRSVRMPAPAEGKRAYLRLLAEAVRKHGADLVVPVSEEAMHVAFLPTWLPKTPVLAMAPEVMLALHHKGRFIEVARDAGVAVPDTFMLGSDQAAAMARECRVVVKPAHSAAGRGVRVVAPGKLLPAPDGETVVQRFLPGAEYSSCTLARDGRVIGTTIYRGVQFAGSVACAFERVDHEQAEAWIARVVETLRWTGFISFDLREDADGRIHGIECNPRTTSGLHFFETADIAPAILGDRDTLRHRQARRLQQFWSCLTETQLSAFRLERAALGHLKNLLRTRDVTWAARDPLPLLTMPYTAWPIMRDAARKRVPFGEVATLDVGWFEGEVRDAPTATAEAPGTAASRTSAAT
ncbi:ATP-grasp domain-containing protein [Falsiroseomonas sp. HW251]|uniref:ATP-grasp domain-containing protein n=1 Tax=Falsiroseomonas sp. HW251 TaxID=3390998 RepID=UPI003D3120EB